MNEGKVGKQRKSDGKGESKKRKENGKVGKN